MGAVRAVGPAGRALRTSGLEASGPTLAGDDGAAARQIQANPGCVIVDAHCRMLPGADRGGPGITGESPRHAGCIGPGLVIRIASDGQPRAALYVLPQGCVPDDEERLAPAERACLLRLGLLAERRREWIRGRHAVRALLGAPRATLLADPDGAPRLEGAPASVSLAHEAGLLAVAVVGAAGRAVGVDLAVASQRPLAGRVLARLGIDAGAEALETWVAVETALKLRRLGVAALLGRRVRVRRRGRRVTVTGLGAPADVVLVARDGLVVGWGWE
jgi:hypothetical protein